MQRNPDQIGMWDSSTAYAVKEVLSIMIFKVGANILIVALYLLREMRKITLNSRCVWIRQNSTQREFSREI
jgi:Tfp pilus assembly protein PilZ